MNVATVISIINLYLNPVIAFTSLAGLIGIWVYYKKPPSIKSIKKVYLLIIFTRIFWSVFATISNYYLWLQNPTTRQLLPPYYSVSYVINYSFNHYWFVPTITILFSLLFWQLSDILNKKFEERFFYDIEPIMMGLGIAISPWPQLFLFIFSVIISLLIIQIINLIFTLYKSKNGDQILNKVPMLYLWLPCGLLSVFMHFFLVISSNPISIFLMKIPVIQIVYKNFIIF